MCYLFITHAGLGGHSLLDNKQQVTEMLHMYLILTAVFKICVVVKTVQHDVS